MKKEYKENANTIPSDSPGEICILDFDRVGSIEWI